MSSGRTRKANIKDVAREAGVSFKTVSRVLNKERYVSDAVRKRVEQAIAKLRYSPNIQARGLAARRSYMVCLLVDDIVGDYIDRIQAGILHACVEEDTHLVVELLPERGTPESDARIRELLSRVNFDGIILTPPVCDDTGLLENLREFGVPVARVGGGGAIENSGLSRVDDFSAASDITGHLIARGHRSIGFVKGDPAHHCSQDREAGFRHAMQVAGLAVRDEFVFPGAFSYASGVAAGEQIARLERPPTAFFVSSDIMAAGIADVLSRAGFQLPQDMSLAGFDDDAICTIMHPHLTTIRQPVSEMACAAARAVIAARRSGAGMPGEPVTFSYELIERDSVADLGVRRNVVPSR